MEGEAGKKFRKLFTKAGSFPVAQAMADKPDGLERSVKFQPDLASRCDRHPFDTQKLAAKATQAAERSLSLD
jgi:hypothetical protein